MNFTENMFRQPVCSVASDVFSVTADDNGFSGKIVG